MSDAMKAIDEIEAALKRADKELTVPAAEYVPAIPASWGHIEAAQKALATLRAALTPPADDELQAIRARHEAWEATTISVGSHAHTDRATLLRLLDVAHANYKSVSDATNNVIDGLSAELAKERERRVEWQPIETAPVDESFLATCRVKNIKGDQRWETYRIVIDSDTGEIDTDIDQPWSLEDYEFWHPIPSPPATLTKDTP